MLSKTFLLSLCVCKREREIKQDEFHIFVKCYVYAGVYGSSCGSFLVQGSHEDGCRSVSQFEGQFACYIHLLLPRNLDSFSHIVPTAHVLTVACLLDFNCIDVFLI